MQGCPLRVPSSNGAPQQPAAYLKIVASIVAAIIPKEIIGEADETIMMRWLSPQAARHEYKGALTPRRAPSKLAARFDLLTRRR
jgi:hypothetical protein